MRKTSGNNDMTGKISKRQMERYPKYLAYLRKLKETGAEYVSSPELAQVFDCSQDQVRKDFQAISSISGRPKTGRKIQDLIDDIEDTLGYKSQNNVVVVGIGHLGTAFMNYQGFKEFGLNIVAGFDKDDGEMVGKTINKIRVYPFSQLKKIVEKQQVVIGIVTVPRRYAQMVIDALVDAGIKAIYNLAPVHVEVPDDIIIEGIDLAASLSVLAKRLNQQDSRGRR